MREGKTVLVISDEAETRLRTISVLGAGGHPVAAAADGPEAIEIAERLRPDVIVCDRRAAGDTVLVDALRGLDPQAEFFFLAPEPASRGDDPGLLSWEDRLAAVRACIDREGILEGRR
jgi:DNA-binding NarL/FixJ family response regulator